MPSFPNVAANTDPSHRWTMFETTNLNLVKPRHHNTKKLELTAPTCHFFKRRSYSPFSDYGVLKSFARSCRHHISFPEGDGAGITGRWQACRIPLVPQLVLGFPPSVGLQFCSNGRGHIALVLIQSRSRSNSTTPPVVGLTFERHCVYFPAWGCIFFLTLHSPPHFFGCVQS